MNLPPEDIEFEVPAQEHSEGLFGESIRVKVQGRFPGGAPRYPEGHELYNYQTAHIELKGSPHDGFSETGYYSHFVFWPVLAHYSNMREYVCALIESLKKGEHR